MIKTDAQIARLLGKADTYVARIDTKPECIQKRLAQKSLNTLYRVYNDTNSKQIKQLIKNNIERCEIISRSSMMKQIQSNIKKQQHELKKLAHSNNNYVSVNHDIANDSFNVMDDIMYNVTFNSDKLNDYIRRKHDNNA